MFYILAVVLIAIDQISKAKVRADFIAGESIPVVDDVFHFTYVQNTGAAFGIFAGHTNLLIYVSGVILSCLFVYSVILERKIKKDILILKNNTDGMSEDDISLKKRGIREKQLLLFSFLLILSGAVGNVIDRLSKGFVTDMFDFRIWPVFNVADIYICLGCILLFFCILKSEDKK